MYAFNTTPNGSAKMVRIGLGVWVNRLKSLAKIAEEIR
jgi:hypothetical protein